MWASGSGVQGSGFRVQGSRVGFQGVRVLVQVLFGAKGFRRAFGAQEFRRAFLAEGFGRAFGGTGSVRGVGAKLFRRGFGANGGFGAADPAPAPPVLSGVLMHTNSTCKRDWYFIAEQPAPAPHLAHPEGCAAVAPAMQGTSRVIPSPFLEPFFRSWSHFEGIYRQKLTTKLNCDGGSPASPVLSGVLMQTPWFPEQLLWRLRVKVWGLGLGV